MTRQVVRIWLVTLAVAAASSNAAAQSYVCDTIDAGDTASAVARRFTGRAENRHEPWFRIVDRARLRVIPKTAYDRILAGWQVCIPTTRRTAPMSGSGPIAAIPQNGATMPFGRSDAIVAHEPITRPPASQDDALALVFAFLAPAVFGAAMGLAWQKAERFLTDRRAMKREAEDFGDLFVKDFERPLVVEDVTSPPIRARLRWVSRHRRLDILLAPAAGHVEYDVDRIAHRLRRHPFVRRPLRAEGQWVVVPFQLKPRS
jgi:hypothetical protein